MPIRDPNYGMVPETTVRAFRELRGMVQTEFGLYVPRSLLGQPNGVATLDGAGKVVQDPASFLPGQPNGVATLDGAGKVVQDPANATATPAPGKIPIADESGKLDGWMTPPANVIFCWSGHDIDNGAMVFTGTSLIHSSIQNNYLYLAVSGNVYRTVLLSKFKKIPGISTITIHARLWSNNDIANAEACLLVNIGGQSNTVQSVQSITPAWVAPTNIDVSSLTDGATYDINIQLKNENASYCAYCSAVVLIAS